MTVRRSTLGRWSRRDFMRAAGIGASVAALAPFVPTPVAEAGGEAIQRLLLFTHPNGSQIDRWRANGTGAAFTSGAALPRMLGPILSPLDAHRDRLILLDGLDLTSAYLRPSNMPTGTVPAPGHAGRAVLWSGARRARIAGWTGSPEKGFQSNAATIDQLIGRHTRERTPSLRFSSLTLGTTNWLDQSGVAVFSFEGPSAPAAVLKDPQVAFDRVFGAPVGGSEDAARRRAEQRSVLDVVRGELTRLRGEVPGVDRARLDTHLEQLRDLEGRIGGGPLTCTVPGRPSPVDNAIQRQRLHLQIDLAVAALRCDLTRVVSLALGMESAGQTWAPGTVEDTHTTSHESWRSTSTTEQQAALERLTVQNRIVAEDFARVLDRLAEGAGRTLLDDTIAVWGVPMSWGGPHTCWNAPFIVASGRSDLRTGRYHRWGNYFTSVAVPGSAAYWSHADGCIPHNRLLVSLMHAMGLSATTYVGDEGGGAMLDNRPIDALFA